MNKITLIVVDCQYDFIQGSLAVKGAEEAVVNIKEYIERNKENIDKIIFTLDWHPANIVMKLSRCRINSNQNWNKCIKISDDLGKHLGEDKEFEIAKYQLGI